MGVENICLKEAAHLVRRDPKYWIMVSHMYLAGLKTPLQSRVFRAAYFFCRHLDDVLDGDREISGDPENYVCTILDGMDGKNRAPKIVDLYKFVIGKLGNNGMDNPQRDFREIIGVMLFDYARSKDRRVLTRQELEHYFNRTFVPVLNISLQIAESELRGNDLPGMVSTMGHLYSIRDMQIDLSRGIINVPQEELELSGLNGSVSYGGFHKNGHLSRWMDCEVREYRRVLNDCKDRLSGERDRSSRRICFPLIGAMERYCERYLRGKE